MLKLAFPGSSRSGLYASKMDMKDAPLGDTPAACDDLAHALHLGGDAGEDQVRSYLIFKAAQLLGPLAQMLHTTSRSRKWDTVVLQEQSMAPAYPASKVGDT